MEKRLEARYGLFTAISMVIGQVIGSGIFFKVDDVLQVTGGNVFAGLLGFIIVGVSVVFAGISMANYAELLPREGGILAYVQYRFGDVAAYLVGWMYLTLFYPILTAVLFTVSGIYIAHLIGEFTGFEPQFIHYSLIGFANLLLFFGLNIFRPKASGIFQQLTTVLKVLPLIFIAAFGILAWVQPESNEIQQQLFSTAIPAGKESFLLLIAASFIPISFAFDGWYIATQISGEIKDSKRNLPRALIVGTMAVMVIYILYYLGIVSRMSSADILNLKDTYITEFARRTASNAGAVVMQLFIIISVLGTSNGLLLATIRVPFQFSHLERSPQFLCLGDVNRKRGMPLNSAFLGLGIVAFYMIAYGFTNMHPFFTRNNFDLSAVPIIFIYMVNGALFMGLFRLFKNRVFAGNMLMRKAMAVVAILGILVVLIGSATAQNGLVYFLISGIFLLIGRSLMRK